MANFLGGSAWAMAKDISEGYILVTDRTYKKLEAGELEKLAFELDRILREARGEVVAADDLAATQTRNRRLARLTGALSMLRSHQQRRFRHGVRQFDGNA